MGSVHVENQPDAGDLTEPLWLQRALIALAVGFLGAFLLLPLAIVARVALSEGLGAYWAAIREEESLAALRLTLKTILVAVPVNLVFGLCAAWALGKFRFRGRNLLIGLIDLPFSISPVIAGLMLVLVYGRQGWLGPSLRSLDVEVIFAFPGIALATAFVTLPYVVREVLPLMEEQGLEEELAASTLGANGWQIFWRITLPNIKLAVLYGLLLCNARAIGEFGAVSVVSGHIAGQTNTVPLHVEAVYNEYRSAAAFAVASLLALTGLLTLLLRAIFDQVVARRRARLIPIEQGQP
jgi:sulfate transport system permease protein